MKNCTYSSLSIIVPQDITLSHNIYILHIGIYDIKEISRVIAILDHFRIYYLKFMNVINVLLFHTKLRTWNVFSANDYRGAFSCFF